MANSRTRSQAAALGWVTRRANIAAREAEAEHERRSAAAILGHQRRKARLAEKASAEAIAQPAKKKKAVSKKRPAKKPAEKKPAAKKRPAKKKAIAKKKAAKKAVAKKRPAKKAVAKKAVAKKRPAKKAVAKKAVAKKRPAKKAVAKKAVAKKRPAKKAVAKKPTARKPSAPAEPAKPAKPAGLPSPAKPSKKRKPAKKKRKAAKKRPTKRRPSKRLSAEEWAAGQLPEERPRLTLEQLEKDYNRLLREKLTNFALRKEQLESPGGSAKLADIFLESEIEADVELGKVAKLLREARKHLADKKASAEIPRPPEYYADIAWAEVDAELTAETEAMWKREALNTEISQVLRAIDKSNLNSAEGLMLVKLRQAAMKGELNDSVDVLLEESTDFTPNDLYTLYFTSLTP